MSIRSVFGLYDTVVNVSSFDLISYHRSVIANINGEHKKLKL
jgi:hypothetical protein